MRIEGINKLQMNSHLEPRCSPIHEEQFNKDELLHDDCIIPHHVDLGFCYIRICQALCLENPQGDLMMKKALMRTVGKNNC